MLHGKAAIITGASGGIGSEIASRFVAEGASLVLNSCNDVDRLNNLTNRLQSKGGNVISLPADVANKKACKGLVNRAIDAFGSIDILINCAGIISRADFFAMEKADWHDVIDVNLNGVMNMCEQTLPHMIGARCGKVINITSQMGFIVHTSASPSYEVSKAGVTALTRHLAKKVGEFNINVNAIAPGSIDTELPKSMTLKQRQALANGIPFKRLGDPAEVANCALFLSSELSSYVTGSTLHVNGGSYMA